MKKIIITGANGLLGQKLVTLIKEDTNYELIATGRGKNRLPLDEKYTYYQMDITDNKSVFEVIETTRPDFVIHTAAMTNVDQCETEREACWQQNVDAVTYLVEAAEKYRFHLIHLSTDFIFDGKNGPYTEEAIPSPLSYYGESKLAAEKIILRSNIKWSIARTVLVFGIAHNMSRTNIVLWVKKNLEDKKTIQVVDDQWRTPTLAEDLALGCFLIVKNAAEGIFNISGEDFLTPYDMAIKVADYFKLDKSFINKTDSSKFKQPAVRPPKTGFIITKAKEKLNYLPRNFYQGIEVLARQIEALH